MKNKIFIIYIYRFSILMLTLSGFGQMPIFKRYYIADIPGLDWLAEFHITHLLHYVFAVIFTIFVFYAATMHLLEIKDKNKDRLPDYFKGGLIAGLILSGFLLVMKNFPGYKLPDMFIIVTDITHLMFAVIFLFFSLTLIIYNTIKARWKKHQQHILENKL